MHMYILMHMCARNRVNLQTVCSARAERERERERERELKHYRQTQICPQEPQCTMTCQASCIIIANRLKNCKVQQAL
jgi:hypothetical protein